MKKAIPIVLIVLAIALIGGYVFYNSQLVRSENSNQESESAADNNINQLNSSPTPTDELAAAPTTTTTPAPATAPTPTPTPTPASESQHVSVVYDQLESISASEKNQLVERIINPVLDYYAENHDEPDIETLTISPYSDSSAPEFVYTVHINFTNGGYSSFMVIRESGVINWWAPSCMICTFSDGYKTKYPGVVSQAE